MARIPHVATALNSPFLNRVSLQMRLMMRPSIGHWAVTKAALCLVLLGLPASVVAQSTEAIEYFHADAIGSVRMVTGPTGEVLERRDFLPFGEELTSPPNAQSLAFAGAEQDAETGNSSWLALNYLGARHLQASIGRFTSVDPVKVDGVRLSDPQQQNLYSYARNNPLVYVDPSGRTMCYPSVGIPNASNCITDADLGETSCVTTYCTGVTAPMPPDIEATRVREGQVGTIGLLTGRLALDEMVKSWKVPPARRDPLDCVKAATADFCGTVKMGGLMPNPAAIAVSAGTFGIKAYDMLRPSIQNLGLQAHHLIERRFAPNLGILNPNKMLSIALDPKTHQMFTNAWREAIRYGDGTRNATEAQIRAAASKIYENYPQIRSALGLP